MFLKISNYFVLILFLCFLSSCSALKSTSTTSTSHREVPRFINGIEVTPSMSASKAKHLEREMKRNEKIEAEQSKLNIPTTEKATALQAKYCVMLDVPVETISGDNLLLQEVDDWWGTPYQYGGESKDGIDCSALTQIFFQDIYSTSIPRTAQNQYDNCPHPSSDEPLQKGDLVFFGNSRHNITHVGMYITNNKFVHASTSKGVMISDLNDTYWGKRYIGSGRYTPNMQAKN